MAQFDECEVINALHPEKAEVGKKYWYADNLIPLKRYVEGNDTDRIGKLKQVDNDDACIFQMCDGYAWEFIYPYEEQPKQRMTNIQLMEWISKRNGMFKHENNSDHCYTSKSCLEYELNEEVDKDIIIRSWDSEEWVEPTVDIYERDCKGDKE